MTKFTLLTLLLISSVVYAQKKNTGETAYWVTHCTGAPLKSVYKKRPVSKKGENLKRKKDICYYITKDFYTKKYGGFQPIVHNDGLEFHLRKKNIVAGDYLILIEATYTPVEKQKDCFKRPKVLERKMVKKEVALNKEEKDNLIVLDIKKLGIFNKWQLLDLEIQLTFKIKDKVIHTAKEKFQNWPKCDIYMR